jgi:hypothetical protein
MRSLLVLFVFVFDFCHCVAANSQSNGDEFHVQLFTNSRRAKLLSINISDSRELMAKENVLKNSWSCADRSDCRTYLIIHGFLSSSRVDWVESMKSELLAADKNSNVLCVHWSSSSSLSLSNKNENDLLQILGYHEEVKKLDEKAQRLASILTEMSRMNLIDSNKENGVLGVHCIGHSLGAHMCGIVGKLLKKNTGMKPSRITGLDPAGPCFNDEKTPRRVKLAHTDADYVDVVHTSELFGIQESIGHSNYYPNGGKSQSCSVKMPDSWSQALLERFAKCEDLKTVSIYKRILSSLGVGGYAAKMVNSLKSAFVGQNDDPNDEDVDLLSTLTKLIELPHFCDHSAAYWYFIRSIRGKCNLVAQECNSWRAYKENKCGAQSKSTTTTNLMGFRSKKEHRTGTPNDPIKKNYYLSFNYFDTCEMRHEL